MSVIQIDISNYTYGDYLIQVEYFPRHDNDYTFYRLNVSSKWTVSYNNTNFEQIACVYVDYMRNQDILCLKDNYNNDYYNALLQVFEYIETNDNSFWIKYCHYDIIRSESYMMNDFTIVS